MESLERELRRGTLELLLLRILADEPTYGYELLSRLGRRSGGRLHIKEGTLYPVLYRLEDADLVVSRLHGLTPFTGTSLDQLLRNLDITTVVATGASVNVGVLGLVLSAVDLGYQVVVPTDAVAGIPTDYADAVLANTVSLLATLTTSAELVAAWG